MRVLALVHAYAPHHCGGAEMTAHALLRPLVERGHQVDVVLSRTTTQCTEPYVLDGVRVHPRRDKADPARWLSDLDRRPHVMVSHLENTDRASILGSIYRVPVVHLLHNDFGLTRRSLTRGPTLVVANTQWLADSVSAWWTERHGSTPMPYTIVVHPPVHAEDYRTTPGAHVTLVNVTDFKGADTFYALAHRFPKTKFLGVEGAYGKQDHRGLPNVSWSPHVPGNRMRDKVYRRTRVVLMPSAYESYGRVAAEASCSGIPTIAAPTPGLTEVLGPDGLYADPDDIDAWAAHLRRLLTPSGWAAASRAALARAEQRHTDADLDRWITAVEAVSLHEHPRHRR